jgi:hypothetical protein
MKVYLPDPEQFKIKEVNIAGDECLLITPKQIGVKWTEDNKWFRSSIWRKSDLYPVSLGFRKFTNLGEQPNFEPLDENSKFLAITKVDGSCLITSKYKGNLIVRTRGTIDASTLDNGFEIEFLKKKYPKVFDNRILDREDISLIYEWTTPTNRIVLNESDEPALTLIGAVYHEDYKYLRQEALNLFSIELQVPRPHSFDMNLENLKTYLETETSIEGVVLYSEDGQTLKKIKTSRYLYLHHIFTGIKTYENFVNLWASFGCKELDEFQKELGNRFDWELVTSFKPFLDRLHVEYEKLKLLLTEIENFVNTFNFKQLSRKQQADMILEKYQNKSAIAFSILDNKKQKPLDKLLEYV